MSALQTEYVVACLYFRAIRMAPCRHRAANTCRLMPSSVRLGAGLRLCIILYVFGPANLSIFTAVPLFSCQLDGTVLACMTGLVAILAGFP